MNVFIAMGTQWRVGASGATGLDYAALPPVMRLTGVAPADRTDTFDALRILESEALAIFHERSKK